MEERLQRSRLLAARDQFVQKLAGEVSGRLTGAAEGSAAESYRELLSGLIRQGIMRLAGETAVEVACRPQDASLVSALAPAAAAAAVAAAAAAGEPRQPVAVSVVSLPALARCAGGVRLSAKNGTIRCDNTLEARLSQVRRAFPGCACSVHQLRSTPALTTCVMCELLCAPLCLLAACAAAVRPRACMQRVQLPSTPMLPCASVLTCAPASTPQ